MGKNNFSRQYINTTKALFPFLHKRERNYLHQMKNNLDDYCESNPVTSVEDLYTAFGNPHAIVYQYYSMMDTKKFFSHIRIWRVIRNLAYFAGMLLLVFTIFISILLYQAHEAFLHEEIVMTDTIITDPEENNP